MEVKNKIKKERNVPRSEVVKVWLFLMVLSIGNFFRAAWTRTLRLETDISHHEPMIFAAAGICQRPDPIQRLDFDHRQKIKFFERMNMHLTIMQEGRKVDESREPYRNEKVLDAAGFHP